MAHVVNYLLLKVEYNIKFIITTKHFHICDLFIHSGFQIDLFTCSFIIQNFILHYKTSDKIINQFNCKQIDIVDASQICPKLFPQTSVCSQHNVCFIKHNNGGSHQLQFNKFLVPCWWGHFYLIMNPGYHHGDMM